MAFDMEEQFSEECVDSGIHEECGVFGAYDFDGNDIASTVYYGLFALQHRGQESCGIAVSDTNGPKKNIQVHKGMGLVNEVFSSENLEKLKGNISVAGTLCIVLLASEFFLPLRLLDGVKYATNILLQESENGLVFILVLADFFLQIFPYIFTIFYILRRVHKEYKAICYDKRKKR